MGGLGAAGARDRKGTGALAEVVLQAITKEYADCPLAVDDLDISVGDGELVVLVGPSGCGKTTALRMIAGLEDVSSGEVRIGDRVVNDVAPRDRDVAMVFQSYALYPHLSVYDNIAFGLRLRKVPKAEIDARVRRAAATLELETLLHRRPRALSGGQRQRVAMGRAIVRQPEAFLMDEPLSNLDAKLRVQMRAEIARLQSELGVTTIYVTHDQTEAMTLGDRVAVLRRGVLQQVDAPDVLYNEPANLFVAGFIGSPAMNLIEATVDGDDLVVGTQRLRLGAARPARRDGKVAVGIRPEDLDEPGAGTANPRLRGDILLVEHTGADAFVHVRVDARPVVTEETLDAAEDAADEIRGHEAVVVARCSPRTTLRPGDAADLAVDVSRLHFFDIDSGSAITEREEHL